MNKAIASGSTHTKGASAAINPYAVVPNVSSESSRFIFPEVTDGIADHIMNHEEGTIFRGAAIADREEFDENAVAKEMKEIANKKTYSTTVTLEDIEMGLIGNNITLSMTDYIARFVKGTPHKVKGRVAGVFKDGYEYLCIRKIFIYFVPLQSALNDKFEAIISLENHAMSEQNRKVATVVFDSNIPTSTFMSMDYYIPFRDVNKIKLTITCNQSAVLPGFQWGALRIRMTALQNTFPKAHNVFPSQVQTYPPLTLLAPHYRDPKVFNARLLQEDLEAMKAMVLTNEISFLGETADERNIKQRTRYAGSRFASADVGTKESVGSGGAVTAAEKAMLSADGKRIDHVRQEALRKERERQLSAATNIQDPTVVDVQNLQGPRGKRFSIGSDQGSSNVDMEEMIQDTKLLAKTPLILESMKNAGMDPDYYDAYLNGGKLAFTRQFDSEGILIPARVPVDSVVEPLGDQVAFTAEMKGKGKVVTFSPSVIDSDGENHDDNTKWGKKVGANKLVSLFSNE